MDLWTSSLAYNVLDGFIKMEGGGKNIENPQILPEAIVVKQILRTYTVFMSVYVTV